MSAVVIDGGLVHYEAFGRGLPILFLHGWLGSWRYWMPTMESVSDKYRTYALDLWGFGDSDKSKSRYDIDDYVDLVDKFVGNMGIGQAPIVGHSLGATVAIEYAHSFPGRVEKIMAISLPMSSESVNRKLIDFANNSMMAKMLWWRQVASHKVVRSETEKTRKDAINVSYESLSKISMQDRIQTIVQRQESMVLAVYGDKDDVVDPGPTRNLYEGNNVRPIGLSESKHFPMLDEASKFNRLLKDFLDSEDLTDLELKEEWRRRTR